MKTLACLLGLLCAANASAEISSEALGRVVSLRSRDGHELARVQVGSSIDPQPQQDNQPELGSLFGAGRRYRWSVEQAGLKGEIWLSTYDLQSFVLVGGELQPAGGKAAIVNGIQPCTIEIERDELGSSRFFINSGNQSYSGSLSLGNPRACQTVGSVADANHPPFGCSTVCAFRGASAADALAIGFVSVRRAEGLFTRVTKGRVLTIQPELNYTGIELPAGQTLRLETLLINTNADGGTRCLEEWADVTATIVQPRFNHSMVGLYNTWYAYWTPTSDQVNADLWMKGADELNSTGLIHYGICLDSPGVWHNRAAFSEDQTWPNLMPKGWEWTMQQVQKRGAQPFHGGFWGHASDCTTVFKEHPEWMVKDKQGKPLKAGDESWAACKYAYYDFDLTIPAAMDWLRTRSVQDYARWGARLFCMDFYGLATSRAGGAVISDPHVTWPTEAERSQMQMMRDTIGEGGAIGVYTSPTNRLVGVIDRARMSIDAGLVSPAPDGPSDSQAMKAYLKAAQAGSKAIQEVARNMAAAYFYNQKLWINDPDPIAVGLRDQEATVEEARMRMMICACSGGFPTLGESPTKMDAGRLALFKKALPVYGHAARAVDLMDHDVATIHHLHVQHSAGDWDVITLFNWNERPQTFELDLASLGVVGPHHTFEFWTQRYVGIFEDRMTFSVPGYACRVLRLTPVAKRPQLIGTDRHVTVGYPELPLLDWSQEGVLSGVVLRPQTEQGTITIYLPNGWTVKQTHGFTEVTPEGSLLRGRLDFPPNGKRWHVEFEQKPS